MESAFGQDLSSVRTYLGRGPELRSLGALAAARREEIAFASRAPEIGVVAHEVAHVIQYRQALGSGDAEREAEQARHIVPAGRRMTIAARPAGDVSFFCGETDTGVDCFDEHQLIILDALGIQPTEVTTTQALILREAVDRFRAVYPALAAGRDSMLSRDESATIRFEPPSARTIVYRHVIGDASFSIESRSDDSGATDGYLRIELIAEGTPPLQRQRIFPRTSERVFRVLPPDPRDLARWREQAAQRARNRRERLPPPGAPLLTQVVELSARPELEGARAEAIQARDDVVDEPLFAPEETRESREAAEAAERRYESAAWLAGYLDSAAYEQDRTSFLNRFRRFALQVANVMLERSYNLARDEGRRYMLGSASEVSDLFRQMDPLRTTVRELDLNESELLRIRSTVNSIAGGGFADQPLAGAYERSALVRAEREQEAVRRRSRQQQRELQPEIVRRFPVLASRMTPIRAGGDSRMHEVVRLRNASALRRQLRRDAHEIADHVVVARRHLRNDPDLIWELDGVIAHAKELASIAPGSVPDQIIDAEIRRHDGDQAVLGLLLGILALALGVLSAGAGTVAVAATVASAGLSSYLLVQSLQDYQAGTSMAGTQVGEERALLSSGPWPGWLVLDIAGLGLDIGAVAALGRSSRFVARSIYATRVSAEDSEAALRALSEESEALAREAPAAVEAIEPRVFAERMVTAARRERRRLAQVDSDVIRALRNEVPPAVRADSIALSGLSRLPGDLRAYLIQLLDDQPETLLRLGRLSEVSAPFRHRLAEGQWWHIAEEIPSATASSTAADLLPPAYRSALGERAASTAEQLEETIGAEGIEMLLDSPDSPFDPETFSRASAHLEPQHLLELSWINRGESYELFRRRLGPLVREIVESTGGRGLVHLIDELDIEGLVRLQRHLGTENVRLILRHARTTSRHPDRASQLVELVRLLDGHTDLLGQALHRADAITLQAVFEHYPIATIAREINPLDGVGMPRADQAINTLIARMNKAEGRLLNDIWMSRLASHAGARMIGGAVPVSAIRVQILTGSRQAIPAEVHAIIAEVRRVTAEEATRLRAMCRMALNRPQGVPLNEHFAQHGIDLHSLRPKVQEVLNTPTSDELYRTNFGAALEQLAESRLIEQEGRPESWFQVVAFGGRLDILVPLTRESGFGLHGRFAVLDWTTYAQAGHINERYNAARDAALNLLRERFGRPDAPDPAVVFKIEILHPGPAG